MPTDGEQEVLRTRALEVTFTHDMDPLTITANTFHVANGATITGTVTYDAATRTATFTPEQRLSPLTAYTASLTGASDIAGVPLADYAWSFKTTEGVWSQPSYIGHYSPIARAPNGDLLGLFPLTNGDVSARVRQSGTSGFATAATLTTTTKPSIGVDIAINATGEGMGIWHNGDISARDLWAVHYSQGTWGSPTLLASLPGDAVGGHVAVAANGDAIVVWK